MFDLLFLQAATPSQSSIGCGTALITWAPIVALLALLWLYMRRSSRYLKRTEEHMNRVEQSLSQLEEHLRALVERDRKEPPNPQ